MRKLSPFLIVLLFSGFLLLYLLSREKVKIISPLIKEEEKIKKKPLEKYTFENLREQKFGPSEITFGKVVKDEKDFTTKMFYFTVEGKKVSGLVGFPKKDGVYPIIVMFRGYVDREIYTTGEGTRRAGEVFAANDFITLAPDFLGYGESASPSANPIEERFQTYVTSLTLLSSLENLSQSLEQINSRVKADHDRVGIWGHSNGGQIALSVLEITGKNYPTVLWAPVSKPFPYSILYYTDEFDDHGKALRKAIADFEKDYDIEKYSPPNFLEWINAPIQLHQGASDESVPQKWSDQLVEELKKLDKDITYYIYPGEDHNFARGSWSMVVSRDITFFRDNFK